MSVERTHDVLSAYFDAMGTGRFSQFFTEDVTWTTIQDDTQVIGADAVQEAIIGLHARLGDLQTRQLVFAENAAYIEGSGTRTGEGAEFPIASPMTLSGTE